MSISQRLLDTLMDEGWKLVQKRVCKSYGQSQRGAGLGGVHSRRNTHTVYPLHSLGQEVTEPKPDSKDWCRNVKVRMVTPAQATVEQAESEAKIIKEQEQKMTPHSSAKRPRRSTAGPSRRKGSKKYNPTKHPALLQ